jgi:thiamine pyrophosphate-dependent acetolactate synthase large subunit-like protein
MNGSQILAEALERERVDMFFFIMGAPMLMVEAEALKRGLRGIDVRHEQAAAMMAHAYARLRLRPGVCMAASGPGVTNLVTGVAHAWADGVPVIALGGSAPVGTWGRGAFQDMDQLAMMEPCTKWAARVHHPKRIPQFLNEAFERAMAGKPGPVYLDLPGDVLFQEVDGAQIEWPEPWNPGARSRPPAAPDEIDALAAMLEAAERPIVVAGSGVLWSQAERELRAFVEQAGIPFYTTPQSRGMIPEDHPLCYLTARSSAFREADLILVVGTRLNYVIGHAAPPRFNAAAKRVRIDIDPDEIATSRGFDLGIVGDARAVLRQLRAAAADRVSEDSFASWRERLRGRNSGKQEEQEALLSSSEVPIHPLRLCKEIRDFIDRDAILVVDGQEILNFGRQTIPSFVPNHRMNSGVFGTMGVGLPLGVGAKLAAPDKQVVVLHGDGSFGMNAMEFDTAVRHGVPVLVVISLNGGWTGDPDRAKPGRDLGYTRYDRIAEALGGHAEYVEEPDEIRPALERAAAANAAGQPALVNVVTDWRARATTAPFTLYVT